MKEWIITSSVLILMLILLRLVFRKRISSRLQYALWSLALLRLLIPVSLWQTPVSVMNFIPAEVISPNITSGVAAPLPTNGGATTNPASQPEQTETQGLSQAETPATPAHPAASPAPVKQGANRQTNAAGILKLIWVGGSIAMALWLAGCNLRFALQLRRHRVRLAQFDAPLPVYRCDAIVSPCLFGRGIYLTPGALADEVRTDHVLAHELCHRKQHDQLWSALRDLCLVIWWWNPLVWAAALLSRRDCEAACDELVIRQLGDTQRLAYSQTLVDMIATASGARLPAVTIVATTMSSHDMRDRLLLLVRRRKVWLSTALAVLLLVAVCACCTLTGAKPDNDLKSVTLTYESTGDDGLLVCSESEGRETVQVRNNGLLSDATLASLRQGDQLTVRYRNRTAREIDAVEITVKPVAPSTPPQNPPATDNNGTQTPATQPDIPDDTPDAPQNPPATDGSPYRPENEAEWITHFQDSLFGGTTSNFYRQALSSTYKSAADVDLFELFYNGFGQSTALSEMELRTLFYNTALEAAVIRVSGAEMDDALRNYFGIGLADTNLVGLDKFCRIPELDTYYQMHQDSNVSSSIQVHGVLTDADGYYYMRYSWRGPLASTESDPVMVCCLHQTDGRWQIVYNIPDTESLPSGASAQLTGSGTPHLNGPIVLDGYGRVSEDQQDAFTVSTQRCFISSDLDYAVSRFLFQEIASFAPKEYFRRSESHQLLALEHQDGKLYVYLVGFMQAANDDATNPVQESLILPVKLCFTPYTSNGRVYYELTDAAYAEDPERPGDIFPDVIGTNTLHADYWQTLEQAIANRDPDYYKTMFQDEDAYFACCAGRTPDEALRNVQAFQSLHDAIRSCQIIGTKENEEATTQMETSEFLTDSAGWSNEMPDFCAMDITYSIEWDRTRYPGDSLPEDGVYIATAYLCRDPDSGVWRVMQIVSQTKLFDYTGNH